MNKRRSFGFTLIELMTVVSIVTILSLIGLPSFKEFIASQRIKNAASSLHSSLIMSRSEALKRNTNVSLEPMQSNQWNSGWKILNPADGGATNISTYNSVNAISISGPTSIIFQGTGRINAATGSVFKISSSGTSTIRCVSVKLSGTPSVTSSGC